MANTPLAGKPHVYRQGVFLSGRRWWAKQKNTHRSVFAISFSHYLLMPGYMRSKIMTSKKILGIFIALLACLIFSTATPKTSEAYYGLGGLYGLYGGLGYYGGLYGLGLYGLGLYGGLYGMGLYGLGDPLGLGLYGMGLYGGLLGGMPGLLGLGALAGLSGLLGNWGTTSITTTFGTPPATVTTPAVTPTAPATTPSIIVT